MNNRPTHNLRMIFTMAMALMAIIIAEAFDLSTYASQSQLSDGKWVKISVPKSGAYLITKSQLSQWGFKDINKVKVYGYGGNRIPEKMTLENYIDDLPMVQSVMTDGGIVFYGVGPEKWVKSGVNYRIDNNIYTTAGYYFLSDKDTNDTAEILQQGTPDVSDPAEIFVDRIHYEQDLYSPGEAGYILVGESFKNQNDRKYNFKLPGRIPNSEVWMETTFVANTSVSTNVSFYIDGDKLKPNTSDRIGAIASSAYLHGDYVTTSHIFKDGGSEIDLRINIDNIATVQNIWLDYIALNYTRKLELPSTGYLTFWSSSPKLQLDGASQGSVTVWDVTNPLDITELRTSKIGDKLQWGNDFTGQRAYVAWSSQNSLPSPDFVGKVNNQNIHGMDNTEMIIFSLPEYISQAERIARLHEKSDYPIKVTVLNVNDVYNEFASGMPDVSALRKCLKMFYDRSLGDSLQLRYALLLGRATYDNRHLTAQFQGATAYNTIPYYMGGIPKGQFSDNTAYGTDDFIALLKDDTGGNLGYDDLMVAVGRMPVTSQSEAKSIVDKLYQYVEECATGTWKNSFLFLADDGDNGIHVKQAEAMIRCLEDTPDQQNFITKVYVDAYDIIGGVCQGGRDEMYRMLDEGLVWWSFTGHANNHSWTGESMLTYTDINNMYLRKLPILMAATCDFLRWDSSTISGGEIMFHERNGGIISAISATRPVYISENGYFTKAIGRAISKRDEQGRLPRLGDIYRNAKNNILTDKGERLSNPNRLRYVLMGDPAMMLPTPSNFVRLETIGGKEVNLDNQVTLKALEQTELTGTIRTPQGEVIEDFNGTVQINIYDAERSITTKGDRDENIQYTFEQHGEKLYSGAAKVEGGHFVLNVAMPSEVADNFRPALMNMYACSTDMKTEAVGINKEFYVYGYDETVTPDEEAPVIESMVLNHASFVNGDVVNESPMVIASVKDNVGINLSAAGVGHQMGLTLDGKRTYTDVSLYYVPASDGSPAGEIRYPLSELTPGDHKLVLKVWDTASNSATQEINFKVEQGLTPTIFDVYTDVNPASTEVKFFVKHNRPDAQLEVTITVYDLLGHPVWETISKGPSDMFVSAPVVWDLCDTAGRRLPRGIYLYRATISTDSGDNYDSATRRLAITAY